MPNLKQLFNTLRGEKKQLVKVEEWLKTASLSDINNIDELGDSPLLLMCSKGQFEVARLLVQHGADVNIQTSHGHSPLLYAVIKDNIELVELLIKKGASVTVATNAGITVAETGKNKSKEVQDLLKKHGARILDKSEKKELQLKEALRSRDSILSAEHSIASDIADVAVDEVVILDKPIYDKRSGVEGASDLTFSQEYKYSHSEYLLAKVTAKGDWIKFDIVDATDTSMIDTSSKMTQRNFFKRARQYAA